MIRYAGLKLEEFETDEVLWGEPALQQAVTTTSGPTFVRGLHIMRPSDALSLEDTLRASERMFARIASDCGATVLKRHAYGLVPLRPGFRHQAETLRPGQTPLLPRNYGLAARVDVIRHAEYPREYEACIRAALADHNRANTAVKWADQYTGQFVVGDTATRPYPHLILADIEPKLQ